MDSPRVKTITIHDFKGFYRSDVAAIDLKGKNLLLYGENGSGKTTIFTALKELLSLSPTREFDNDFRKVSCLKNRLSSVKDISGIVRLEFEYKKGKGIDKIPPMEWLINKERPSDHSHFKPMSLSSGFLDYRAILLTHFLDYENDQINLFKLVVETLLRDIQTTQASTASFGSEWEVIQEKQTKVTAILNTDKAKINIAHPDYLATISALGFEVNDYPDEDWEGDEGEEPPEIDVQSAFHRFTDDRCDTLTARIDDFVTSLQEHLRVVQERANQYLKTFDPWLEIVFDLTGITIPTERTALARADWKNAACLPLQARFRGILFEHPGTIFNEARLTALALTIYLAALKLQGEAQARADDKIIAPRLLVLDDVLIGLDMVHRLPILETLETQFIADGWQVILMTFDKTWYDVAKRRNTTGKWENYELFAVQDGSYEKPVLLPDDDHLERARRFLDQGEVKAAAVHIRTKFELVLKKACAEFHPTVPYHPENVKPQANELWNALVTYSKAQRSKHPNGKEIFSQELEAKITHARDWVMNPLSHSEEINSYRLEIDKGLYAVEELEQKIIEKIREKLLESIPTVEELDQSVKAASKTRGTEPPSKGG